MQLSPSARYYICRFLREIPDDELTKLLPLKIRLMTNDCVQLDVFLKEIYPDKADLSQIILQLENLIYFYTEFNFQAVPCTAEIPSVTQIKRHIFRLLGGDGM